jgi:argininosuccinate lyase
VLSPAPLLLRIDRQPGFRFASEQQKRARELLHVVRGALDALRRSTRGLAQIGIRKQDARRHADDGKGTTQLVAGVARELTLPFQEAGETLGVAQQSVSELAHFLVCILRHLQRLHAFGVRLSCIELAHLTRERDHRRDRPPQPAESEPGRHIQHQQYGCERHQPVVSGETADVRAIEREIESLLIALGDVNHVLAAIVLP